LKPRKAPAKRTALASQLFTAASDALEALAEAPCASNAEFVEKLRYLLAHETRIFGGPPNGHQDFGYILVALSLQSGNIRVEND
jgi:hypothetical protein